MTDYRPQRPYQSLSSRLWTYQDAVEHVLDAVDEPRSNSRALRQAKRAVLRAYRDLPSRHPWSCYDRRRTLATVAQVTTGTATYDHTGGASERLVTLSSAVVPAAARFYRFVINSVHYPIDEYKDTTTFTLPENENPGSDISDATDYILYRNAYPLPVDYGRIGSLFDVATEREIEIVSSDQEHAYSTFFSTPSYPNVAAIREASEYLDTLQLVFGPPPSTARTYDMIYERSPRPLLVEKLSTGTVSTSTTTVTASSSVFDEAKHVGSVIRFSADGDDEPTGIVGAVDSSDTDNPYVAQRVIQSVTNGTTAVIDTALSSELSDVKYVVSDPIDLEVRSMLTYFQRLCEAEFGRLALREDRHERRSVADRELIAAMEADNRVRAAGEVGTGAVPFHKREWSTIGDEVVNPSV